MAIAVLGTTTVHDVTAITTGFTYATHDVAVGTDCLLVLWITRAYSSSGQPTLTASWNGVAVPERSTNYSTGAAFEDVVYWCATLASPATGVHDLVFATCGINQRGGTLLLLNLSGVDATTPIGPVAWQRQATASTPTVSLTITPETPGNLVLTALAVSLATTLSSFTTPASGWVEIDTGQTSASNALTRTLRYKLGAAGTPTVTATFAAGDADIGGVLLEVRASSTTIDDSIDMVTTPDLSIASDDPSSASAASAPWWDGRDTWTATLIYQADDIGADRNLVRIGSGAASTLAIRRLAAGRGTGVTNVVACDYTLSDGVVAGDSVDRAQTQGLSVVSLIQAPGDGAVVRVDGRQSANSYKSGGGLSGQLALGGLPVEIGAHSGPATLLPFAGTLAALLVDSRAWTLEQHRALWRCLATPDDIWGQGDVNLSIDPNRSPVTLPVAVTLDGAPFIEFLPTVNDPDRSAPTLTAVGAPLEGGTAEIRANGRIRYTPPTGFTGPDRFTFTFGDGVKASTAWAAIDVRSPALTAVGDTISVQQNVAITFDPAANDTGGVGPLFVVEVGVAAHGTAVLLTDGRVQYTPATAYTGPDAFSYTVSDGQNSAGGTVTATVSATAAAVAAPDSFTVIKDVSSDLAVLGNDSPTGVVLDAITVAPVHGTALVVSGGLIRYTPTTGYLGDDSLTYRNRLPSNNSTATALVSLQVQNVSAAYAWPYPLPRADAVTASMVKLWTPGTAFPAGYVDGDILVIRAPATPITTENWITNVEFKGHVVVSGADLRPIGIWQGSGHTASSSFKGITALMRPKFSSTARSHVPWEVEPGLMVNWPVFMLCNSRINYQTNVCNFGDIIRGRVTGAQPNNASNELVGPKAVVLWNKVIVERGPHYASKLLDHPTVLDTDTTNDENGHSDGVQSLKGLVSYRAGDCQINWPAGQLFFSGQEGGGLGWPRTVRWKFKNVAVDHAAPWTSNSTALGVSLLVQPQFVKAYEESATASGENYNYAAGQYMATIFESTCYMRGQWPKTQWSKAGTPKTGVVNYFGGPGGITEGLSAAQMYRFLTSIPTGHTFPAYAGLLKYLEPAQVLPQTCDPAHAGVAHRVTSVAQFMSMIQP